MEKKKYKANRDRYEYSLYAIDSLNHQPVCKLSSNYSSRYRARKDISAAKQSLYRLNGNHMLDFAVSDRKINNYKSKRSIPIKNNNGFNRLDTKVASSWLHQYLGSKK